MKYFINVAQDLEELIIMAIREHLFTDIRIGELYPQFSAVRVSGVHPFAYLIDQQINQTVVPAGLFPSITIVDDSDSKDSRADIATLEQSAVIGDLEMADIDADPLRNKYIISPTALQDLKTKLTTLGEGETLHALGESQRRQSSMIVEIWDNNVIVKNRLYDIIRNFLIGFGRFSLLREHDIMIIEDSVSGQRGGNYNFDFGYIIYGAILRFDIVQVLQQYVVDTEIEVAAEIVHTTEEVSSES